MKIVDARYVLEKAFNVLRWEWLKIVKSVDANQHGGWMFGGEWFNLRFQDGISAPCPVIGRSIKTVGENTVVTNWLFILNKNGEFELVNSTTERAWADEFFPDILSFFNKHNDAQVQEVTLSGQPLSDAMWLRDFMTEGSTLRDAVNFAVKYTKDSWSTRFENCNPIQREGENT